MMARDLPHPTTAKDALPVDFRAVEESRHPDAKWHFRLSLRWPFELAPQPPEAPALGAPQRLLWVRRTTPVAHDIQVFGHVVDWEVDAHHYLEDLLRLQGRAIVSANPVRLPSGLVGDAVATWEHEGSEFAGRFFASKWGPRIFVVSVQAERERYHLVADDFFETVASFDVLDDSLGELAELVQPVMLTTPAKWTSFVPDSWRVKLEMPEKHVAGFTAANLRGGDLAQVDGMLSVGVALRKVAKKPRKAARLWLDAVKHSAIVLEHEDFSDEVCRKPFARSWCCITHCELDGAVGELRCRVMMSKRYWVVAGLVGPRREDDAASWAQNKRALDIATATLEIG